MAVETKRREGWGFIDGVRKAHYYGKDGKSLCRRYYKFTDGELDNDDKPTPDDCVACRRELDKRTAVG